MDQTTKTLIQAVDQLSDSCSLKDLFHEQQFGNPLPSQEQLQSIVDILRSIIFPGFYGRSNVNINPIKYKNIIINY